MRRLDRYIFLEVLLPTLLGFLVYTSILLIQFLFRSAEMIIRRGLPASDVGQLVLFSLPNIVVLTIPMAFLFGILVAVGRLASDSELIAMRSCGVSLFYLYRPILALSVLLTVLNTFLMVSVLPRGNNALQQLRLEIVTKSVAQQVEPRVFYEEWEGLVLYVFEMAPGGDRWEGVFLGQDVPGTRNTVTVARSGRVRVGDEGETVVLEMEDAITHEVDFSAPEAYETKQWQRLTQVLEDEFASSERARVSASKGLRELTLPELRERLEREEMSAQMRNLTRVEIHKKFSIPAACLVFGLVALPLGFNNRRGGKSSSFALSILVILFYYVMISNGEEAARVGKIPPWLGMWLPNLVLMALGLFLLWRKNRDKSLVLATVDRAFQRLVRGLAAAVRHRRTRRRRQRVARREQPDIVLRLPRLRLRFPNLLDRYIIRLFGWVFLLVTLSAVSVYIVSDLTENIDDILNNQVETSVVIDYYKYLSIQIFFEIAPILVLVTTLIAFALLSRTNEVTAAKSLGVSLYRLSLPAVFCALGVALFCGFLEGFVLPASNARVAALKDEIKGRSTPRTYRRADRQWLFGQGRYIYNYMRYDEAAQTLDRLQVFEFDDQYDLTRRLFAAEATFDDGVWIFEDSWDRTFDGLAIVDYERFPEPVPVAYPETPSYFESDIRAPEQMAFGELRDYIRELQGRGQSVPELEVQLYNKIAFPVVSLVMALLALPFAFRLGKRGALYGVGIAVVLGMFFLGVFAFFTTLGETGALPPAVAVWAPGVVFGLASIYLFLGIRT